MREFKWGGAAQPGLLALRGTWYRIRVVTEHSFNVYENGALICTAQYLMAAKHLCEYLYLTSIGPDL